MVADQDASRQLSRIHDVDGSYQSRVSLLCSCHVIVVLCLDEVSCDKCGTGVLTVVSYITQ